MNTKLPRFPVSLAIVACTIVLALTTSPAADTGNIASTNPTPLEQALTKWRQGDQPGAIDQFLKIDWKANPLFSPNSPLAAQEADLPKLSGAAREKLMAEAMASLKDLKQLFSAAKQKAVTTSKSNPVLAQTYSAKLQECAAALDKPMGLTIVRLTAKAMSKLAAGQP